MHFTFSAGHCSHCLLLFWDGGVQKEGEGRGSMIGHGAKTGLGAPSLEAWCRGELLCKQGGKICIQDALFPLCEQGGKISTQDALCPLLLCTVFPMSVAIANHILSPTPKEWQGPVVPPVWDPWCPQFGTHEAREGSFSTQALKCHSKLGLPTSFLMSVGAGGLSGRAL